MQNSPRIATLAGAGARAGALVVATLMFVAGLIAPLTPSTGRPHAASLLLFVGAPIALSLGVALSTRRAVWRVIGVGLALLVAGAAAWLNAAVL